MAPIQHRPILQSEITLNSQVQQTVRPLGLDQAKYAQFPQTVRVAETGYRKRASSDGRKMVEVDYLVPWGYAGGWWERYVLGYSDSIQSPNGPGAGGVLTRQIPLQCPLPGHFELYASECELQPPDKTSGAAFNDPTVCVRDDKNGTVPDPNLPALQQAATDADAALAAAVTFAANAAQALAAGIANHANAAQLAALGDQADIADANLAAATKAANLAAAAVQAASNGLPIDWPCWIDTATGGDGYARYHVVFTPARGGMTIRNDGEVAQLKDSKGELERYCIREIKNSVQALPLPAGSIIFSDPAAPARINNTEIPESASFLLYFSSVYRITFCDVPDVPWDAIDACVGTTNANPFDGARGALRPTPFPAGQMLLQAPPSIIRKNHITGRFVHDVVFEWLIRPQTWGSLPASDGKFYNVQFRNGGAPLFKSSDHAALFRMGAPVQY
jgi:hypothetical protein